jgi:hypothetical protein
MAYLWLLFKKIGYQEENYNFWDFSTTIFDIKCRLWMKLSSCIGTSRGLVLVYAFPVMFQSLLKPHYVYTAWLHKISPPLIVCRICFINSIRNLRHGFADNRSKNSIHQVRSEWCNFSRQFHVFNCTGCAFSSIFRVCVKKSIFLVKSLLIYDSRSILNLEP